MTFFLEPISKIVCVAGVGILGAMPQGPAKNRAFSIMSAAQPIGFILGLVLGALLAQTRVGWVTTLLGKKNFFGFLLIIKFSVAYSIYKPVSRSSFLFPLIFLYRPIRLYPV
jgi:hypothetical protein